MYRFKHYLISGGYKIMSSKSNFKKIRGTFLLGSTVAGIVGTAAASVSAQVPGAQTTKSFFEGAKSWGSEMLSGAKDLGAKISEGARSFGNTISSKASSAKGYIGDKVSSVASTVGDFTGNLLGKIDDSTNNIFSRGFNYVKNTGFGKAVSKVTSPVADFVKAHPYVTSMALIGASVFVLYKFFNRRPGKEVKENDIGDLVDQSSGNKNEAANNNIKA